jgi:hypothetical protein
LACWRSSSGGGFRRNVSRLSPTRSCLWQATQRR